MCEGLIKLFQYVKIGMIVQDFYDRKENPLRGSIHEILDHWTKSLFEKFTIFQLELVKDDQAYSIT